MYSICGGEIHSLMQDQEKFIWRESLDTRLQMIMQERMLLMRTVNQRIQINYADKNINGTYNGISVQDTWEEQEKYIKEDKIANILIITMQDSKMVKLLKHMYFLEKMF